LKGRALLLAACPLAAILLHLPTWNHEFVFDDRAIIVQNPLVQDVRRLPRLLISPYWATLRPSQGLYRPLTSLSFALNRALAGGLDPRGFHLVNVLLHGLATLLVTLLALDLLPGRRGAACAGLLFAAHPIHVEAVAGVVGRAEILAACGVLGMILCHRRAQTAPLHEAWRWRAGSWSAGLLGMAAKESAAVAIVLCALGERTLSPSEAPVRGRGALYAGHVATLGAMLIARLAVLGTAGVGQPIPFVDNPAASAGAVAGRLTALGAAARYAGLLLWPRWLSADYSYDQIPVIRSPFDPLAVAGLLVVLGLLAAGGWLLARAPVWGYALLWIPGSALLTSNLAFFIGTLLAERLMYLPSVGLCLLAGGAVAAAGRSRVAGRAAAGAALLAAAACAARTWTRLPDWKDDFALYQSAARVSPRSARIRYNLGNAYLRRKQYPEAEEGFRAALGIYPEFRDARINLGMAVLEQGRAAESLGLLESAAALAPEDADVAVNLGTAYRALGDEARAETAFRRALELDPRSARAWNNLGSIDLKRGDVSSAIKRLERAVQLDPDLAVFRVNLADALTSEGRAREAAEQFVQAARLDPDLPESHRGLGEVALQSGNAPAAEKEFRLATSAAEPSARACNFLGYMLARRGDYREAAAFYEKALGIDPTLHDAHRSLGLLYARDLHDAVKAAAHLRRSLAIAPEQPGAEDLRRLLRELERSGTR